MDQELTVAVGDVELFVRQIGPDPSPAPPLVVVHGGPSWDHSYLLPGLMNIARHRRVVLFDMRGCGRSSRDLGPSAYQPEFVVEDLAGLIAALDHPVVDLLGFSTGGQVTQLFAQAHPQAVRRLVLASTTAYPDTAPFLDRWPEYRRRQQIADRVADGGSDLEVTVSWAVNGAPTAIWDLDKLEDYLALLQNVSFSGDWLEPFTSGRLHSWRPTNPERVLNDLDRPVLILHGAQDMCCPVQLARRLHAAAPNSRLQIIDQAGHMVPFEQPRQWASAVTAFLAD